MRSAGDRPTASAIRAGIRIEDLGSEVVALDPAGGRVHRLTGAAAAAVRDVLAGRAPSPEVSRALADAGILRSGRAPSAPAGAHLSTSRRAVVAAATLGITTLLLPSADASASPGGLAAGSTGYLTVTGVGNSSLAEPGALQFVSFTATTGDRHVTPNEPLQVEVLLVGGGGGGAYGGGGGGGGAVTRQILTLDGGQRYDVVVGSGGVGSDGDESPPSPGASGAASTFSRTGTPSVELLRAAGGGGGAYANGDGGDSTFPGGDGSGTSYAEDHASGGGGGAAGLGASAVGGDGGDGGDGALVTAFVGDPETYGGGGGGGGYVTAGAGGAGGGGAGGSGTSVAGTPGTAGSGGGGGGGSPYGDGGAGGSGLVMIRYYGAQPAVNIGFPMM